MCTSRWGRSWMLPAFGRRSTSSSARRHRGSRSPTTCRNSRSTRHRRRTAHLESRSRDAPGTRVTFDGADVRAVVLVEGISDLCALEALAERRGPNLSAEDISVVPIGGAQAIGRFLNLFGPDGLDVRLAGMCDAAEEDEFRRGLERAGFGSHLTRADMEALGFYVCVADLEDELIRALGAAAVEQILDDQRELRSFRTYQKQPAHQRRTKEQQLHGFMWNRKIRYARLLVDALDLTRVPRPLDLVLAHV